MIFILTFVHVTINLSITYIITYELPMNGNYIIDLSCFIIGLSFRGCTQYREIIFWKINEICYNYFCVNYIHRIWLWTYFHTAVWLLPIFRELFLKKGPCCHNKGQRYYEQSRTNSGNTLVGLMYLIMNCV